MLKAAYIEKKKLEKILIANMLGKKKIKKKIF